MAGIKQLGRPKGFAQLNRGHQHSQNLVARWIFCEQSGLLVQDTKGSNNGTLVTTGPTLSGFTPDSYFLVSGNSGNYVDFGTDVSLADLAHLAPFSACCWVRMSLIGNGSTAFLLNKSSGGGVGFHFVLSASGTTPGFYVDYGTFGDYTLSNFTTFDLGRWYHIAITKTEVDTPNLVKFYVNGVDYGISNNPSWGLGSYSTDAAASMTVGSSGSQANNIEFADVSVYNTRLSEDFIKSLVMDPWAAFQTRKYWLGISPTLLTVSDDANTLSDSALINYIIPLFLSPSDNANILSDSPVESNDAAPNYGVILSDTIQGLLLDAILVIGGDPDFHLQLSDTISLSDSVNLGREILLVLSDAITILSDSAFQQLVIPVEAFDSLQFNWADAFDWSFVQRIQVNDTITLADFLAEEVFTPLLQTGVADSITILTDAIKIINAIGIKVSKNPGSGSPGDLFVLSDSISLKFNALAKIADNLNILSDTLTLSTGGANFADTLSIDDTVSFVMYGHNELNFTDTLALTDSATVQRAPVDLTLLAADTLTVLTDALNTLLATNVLTITVSDTLSLSDFVAVNSALELRIHSNESITLTDSLVLSQHLGLISRIRRYLGDL